MRTRTLRLVEILTAVVGAALLWLVMEDVHSGASRVLSLELFVVLTIIGWSMLVGGIGLALEPPASQPSEEPGDEIEDMTE